MNKTSTSRASLLTLILCAVGALPATAVPGAAKLGSRPASGQENGLLGVAVALNDKFAVVGESHGSQRHNQAGAVHVYSAASGKFLRSLIPADLAVSQFFGISLALHGHLLAVGSGSADAAMRSVYLFDLRSGKLLRKLAPQSQATPASFGSSLALTAEALFVGASGENNDTGAVYAFDPATGSELTKFTSSNPTFDDQLGASLAVAGDILFAGAPGSTNGSGAVVLFNWRQNTEVKQIFQSPPNPDTNMGHSLAVAGDMVYTGAPKWGADGAVLAYNWVHGGEIIVPAPAGRQFFGWSLAAERGIIAVGEFADSSDPGTVTLIKAEDGQVLGTLTGEQAGDRCGMATAFFGGRLLMGAPFHEMPPTLLTNSGAAYLIEAPAARDLPMTHLMATKTPANGGGNFRALGDAFINNAGKTIAAASLSGTAPASANAGVWAEFAVPGTAELVGRKGFNVNGNANGLNPRATKVDMPVMNRDGHALVRAIFPGGHEGIFKGDGTGMLDPMLAQNTGFSYGNFNGAKISKYLDLVQSTFVPIMLGDPGSFAVRYRLANSLGLGNISKSNDSGILIANSGVPIGMGATPLVTSTREGLGGPMGTTLMEVGQRVAYSWKHAVFTSQVSGLSNKPSSTVIRVNSADSIQTLVAFSGQLAPGPGPGFFRTFNGVGVDSGSLTDSALWKATLTGNDVSSKNNQGLWHESRGQLLRKGDQVPTETVAPRVWDRVLGVWPAGGLGRVIVLARIKGSGVKATNDVGLWLLDDDNVVKLLLKEGQRLALPDAPHVGVISRVDVYQGGHYVVLATLTGAAAGRNQVLFSGDVSAGNTFSERVAVIPAQPVLRKGERFTQAFFGTAPVTVKSLTLPQVLDPDGMGGRGKGQVVDAMGNVAIKLSVGSQDILLRGAP